MLEYRFGRVYRYHRVLLKDGCRELYDRMLDVLNAYPAKTSLHVDPEMSDDTLMFVFKGVLNDHPLLFWVEPAITIARSRNDAVVTFGHNSLYGSRNSILKRLENACGSICNEMGMGSKDDYAVSLAVHDHLVRNVVYEDTGDAGHCAAGPILEGKGVCEGISEAYSLLMTSLGVRCTKIDGHLMNSDVGHSWNISKIDGHFCHTDVTSDLPGYHRYFNCDDEIMELTHRFKRFVQCDSMDFNYYVRNKCLFDDFDEMSWHIKLRMKLSDRSEFMLKNPADLEDVLRLSGRARKGCACNCTCSDDNRTFVINYGY